MSQHHPKATPSPKNNAGEPVVVKNERNRRFRTNRFELNSLNYIKELRWFFHLEDESHRPAILATQDE